VNEQKIGAKQQIPHAAGSDNVMTGLDDIAITEV
jgi:hypothetical protein